MNIKLENVNDIEESYRTLVIRRFKRHKLAVAGVIIMVIITIFAVGAAVIAPYAPNELSGPFSGKPSIVHKFFRAWCSATNS